MGDEAMDSDIMKAEPPDLALVESYINLLNPKAKESSEFLNHIQTICEAIKHFELVTVESKILIRILPVIHDRFEEVLSNTLSIFEFVEDDPLCFTIKDSLEEIFKLTEAIQEILNFILEQSPIKIATISFLADFISKFVQLFASHYNSSDKYKDTYLDDLSKITVALRFVYTSVLCLLKSYLSLDQDDIDGKLLADVILALCQMPNIWHPLDKTFVLPTWKCIGAIIAKHSSLLENHLDVNIPIKLLATSVCKILEQLAKEDSDYQFEIKTVSFLVNIVFKICIHEFYQQINSFASELLFFYVRVLSYSQEYYKFHKMSDETIKIMEANVHSVLEINLQHLILGQINIFKEHILHFPEKLRVSTQENNNPYGFLILYNHLLKIIANGNSNWSDCVFTMIQDIFDALKQCRQELFWKPYNNGIYETLIVNITAAILVHDTGCQCPELLIKYLLQNHTFVAILALEVYTLLIRNIPPEDCLALLINLLYSVEDLTIGHFTHRPEMVYLKCLLKRMFEILTDPLKEQILKMFQPEQHIQVWRFLGFGSVPEYRIKQIMQPVIQDTLASIKEIDSSCDANYILNVGEGLHLISTAKDLNLHDESLKEVVTFLYSFWAKEIGDALLDNNWLKFFVSKVDALTVACIQNNCLNPQLVFSKLKILSKNSSYWIPIFKIISLLLNSKRINKQEIISQISDLLPLVIDKTIWLEENYLEMLMNLNKQNNEALNILLDSLRPDISHKVFEYIESFKQKQDDINLAEHLELLKVAPILEHKCIVWNNDILVQDEPVPVQVPKSFKFNSRKDNVASKRPYSNDIENPKVKQSKPRKKKPTETICSIDAEDESCVSEVISRLKGEVKCLVKVCYREKLTGKDCADLRMLMAQISSVIR